MRAEDLRAEELVYEPTEVETYPADLGGSSSGSFVKAIAIFGQACIMQTQS
jgi:hypothetical protein